MGKVPVCVNVDLEDYEKFREKCIRENTPFSKKIRDLISEYINR